MKNKKYILFIISFLFALLIFTGTSYAGSQEWKSLDYDVKLNKDGSMDVIETWNIRVTETNTLFKTFKIDKSKYKEIINVSVEQVYENNQTQKFTKINQQMYHVTKNCYYGLQTKSNEFEIAWGVGVDGSQTNTYKISYKVIDAVKVYNDCSELYWQFLGTDNGITGKNITGTIKLPIALDNKENLKAWAHGPLNGEITIVSNDTVKFSLPSIDSKTMLEVRIATLENIFTSSLNKINSSKLDSIISEETKWANDANNQRIKAKIVVYAINVIIVLLGIWFITRIIKYNKIRKQVKKLEPTMKVEYFRDIPDENATPAEAAFLYYFKSGGVKPNISKIFSATLLDLCLKKLLTFEMTDDNKFSNVKIILTKNDNVILKDSEKIIYNQLEKMATKYGDKITIKQLQSYIESNSERFVKDLEKIDKLVKEEEQEKKNYDKDIAKKGANYQGLCVVYIVFAFMCGFFVLMYSFISIILSAILIVNAILCGNIASRYNGLTQKGVDEKELWRGLKKYIEEFSMIDEKEVPELVLWEKYLVFATVFGIADKVIKQLKVVYPQLSQDDVLVGNYTYMYIMCHSNFNTNFVTSLNRTINSAYSSAYSSTYSSGSGSGGGFSVGGGGRRRRWPVAEEDKKGVYRLENKYNNFKELINEFYETILNDTKNEDDINSELKGKIKINPKVIFEDISNNLKVEFYINLKNKSYKIKNLSEFYMLFLKHEKYKYGDSLEFIHEEEVFAKESKDILNFLLKYAELSKSIKDSMNIGKKYLGKDINDSSIILTPNAIDELFSILDNKWVQMEKQGIDEVVQFIKKNPDVKFKISRVNEKEYKILSTIDKKNKYYLVKGAKFSYMLLEDKLYQYDENFENTTLKILEILRKNLKKEIVFSKNQAELLFGIVVPNIDGKVICKVKDLEQYIPQKLNVKLYLDYDKTDNITCKMKFKYGEIEFNPLEKDLNIKIPRNIAEETEVFNTFMKIGFLLDNENLKFVLQETEKIYKFLVEDIFELKNKFEVLVSNTFKNKQIKPLKINSIGVKLENNLLEIDLSKMDINPLEIMNIMQDYKLKKKYYRLIDGSFLELQNSKELEFINSLIDDFDLDYQDIKTGHLKISKSRVLYLDKILKNLENTNIVTDSNYKTIINNITQAEEKIEIPKNLQLVLRDYQKKGYEWLKVLEKYGFSGILADDMGLGKTIQILSIIVAYVENTTKTKPCLVVAPSSLVLNWKKEIEKFAKNIRILLINGKQEERHRNIKNINKYDLIITSYDLLKRDIEIYREMNYEFKYMIADEAQYIKNENTQNAKSMKQINAENRFALTGTPIENSLSELWSIFDYIMPGYLFSYRKFRQNYELPIVIEKDEKVMEHLKMLIEPFILRRTKKQVLEELPEKNVTILNNEMTDEQQKIYLSYLSQAKEELKEQIESYGFEKTRIKILALLTRLRQICCYPGLFIENYENESGKLAQCMELVKQAISSNHKILLFSGYTSMLEVIEHKLRNEDISYFKLTGQTKLDERMRLVEEFNNYDETQVFLISLKAGGTGLNLTGADIVIHYDPWWNISVENQATDRAYRIGQKKNVQVYKLITKNSIEEKMYNLQQRKAELIDNILDTNTTFINKLSKEEIMGLFEE